MQLQSYLLIALPRLRGILNAIISMVHDHSGFSDMYALTVANASLYA